MREIIEVYRDDLDAIYQHYEETKEVRRKLELGLERIIAFENKRLPTNEAIERIKKIADDHLKGKVKY